MFSVQLIYLIISCFLFLFWLGCVTTNAVGKVNTHTHTHTHTQAVDCQSRMCVMNNTGWEFDQWPVAESLCAGLRLRKVLYIPMSDCRNEGSVNFLFTTSH